MARKNPVGKLAETALSTLKDPVGAAGKVVGQAKGTVAIGKLVADSAGSVAGQVVAKARGRKSKRAGAPVRTTPPSPTKAASSPAGLRAVPDVNEPATMQPAEKTTAKKAPVAEKAAEKSADSLKKQGDALADAAPAATKAAKKAPAAKAPAAKKAPGAKKAPAKKAAAEKVAATPADVAEVVEAAVAEDPKKTAAQPAKKAAKKAAAKKAPAKKAAAKKSSPGDRLPAKKTAEKSAQKPAQTSAQKSAQKSAEKTTKSAAALAANESDEDVRTPSGIPAVTEGKNPDTSETDLTQPGTESLVDPSTAKQVASEAETLGKAADPERG